MDVQRIVVINEKSDPTIAEAVQKAFARHKKGIPVPIFMRDLRSTGLLSPIYKVDEELVSQRRDLKPLDAFKGNVYYAHCNKVYASEDLIDY